MEAVSISTFYHQVVNILRPLRILEYREVPLTKVSGKDQTLRSSVLLNVQHHDARSQNVSGIHERTAQMLEQIERTMIVYVLKIVKTPFRILCCIQRLEQWLSRASQLFVQILNIFLLNVRAIEQQRAAKLLSRGCTID